MAKKGGSDDLATAVKLKDLRRVCPAFHQLPVSKIEQLKQHSSKLNYPPGSVICRKGKPHDKVLYIQKGSVGLYAGEGAEGDVTLKSGAVFGEASLLVDSGEWEVTSVTKENTALVMMQKHHYEEAFNLRGRALKVDVPDPARVALDKAPLARSELDHQAVADAFGSMPLFKNMMPLTRERCLKHLTLEDFAPQTCILSQGEHTDYIMCILSGSVSLHVQEHLQRQASSEYPSESSEASDSDESEDEAEANGDAAADTADEEEDLFEDEEEDAEEDVFDDDAEGADSSQSKPAELDASLARTRRGSVGALGSAASACTKECVEEAQIDIVETYGECVTVVYALDVLGEAALGDRERHTMSAVAREHGTVLRLAVEHLKEPPEEEVMPIPPQHVRRLMKDVRAEEAKELLPLLSFSAHLHSLAPHFRLALCKAFQYQSFPAGVNVVKERVVAAETFIVLSGTLAVHQRKAPLAEEEAAVLDENGVSIAKPEEWRWWGDCKSLVAPGMCIKETALTQTFAQPSTYSVVTLCPTEVISLSKAAYNIVQRNTEEQVREGKVKMLRGVPAINNLPTQSLERIVRCMQMKKPAKGDVIYRAGQPSNFTYLLRLGKCVSESKDPKTGRKVTTEHSPGEMLGIREVIFSVPYLATMRCAEDDTELLMNESEDLSRHSKGILRGLNAYAPPPGMELSLSQAPAAKDKESTAPPRSFSGDAHLGGALQHSQTMPSQRHNSALLVHSRSMPSGVNRTVSSAQQRAGTPISRYGSQSSTVPEKARNPMSWGFLTEQSTPRSPLACASSVLLPQVAREFGAFETSSPSSPDTPGVSSPSAVRNQSPPRRSEPISSDPPSSVPAWLRRSQQQLTRTHPVELAQSNSTRSPTSCVPPAAAATTSRRGTHLGLSPRSVGGAAHGGAGSFLGSESVARFARPTTSPGMNRIASMSRAGGGAADLWRPSTAQALMPEDATASVPRAALGLSRASRLAIPAHAPPQETERGADRASLTPSSSGPGSGPAARVAAAVQVRQKRDSRSDGGRRDDTAQTLQYARRSMGIDPVLDPELRFMADVAWEAKKQHLDYDRMPGIDAHLNPEDLPTKAPAHVRFSRGYYYENSPMGPLRDQHDEYNRPRRLWNYSDAKDMKTQWTTTPIRPRVPRPNAVTHQLASQDFKPEVGGAELKLMCHVREVVPYSKFASHEKALMDFSRALMKRKTDEARKNAEAGKYDFND